MTLLGRDRNRHGGGVAIFIRETIDLSRNWVNSIELSPSTSYGCFTRPTIASSSDNARDLIEISLKEDNYFY